jgi:hypothetical protein
MIYNFDHVMHVVGDVRPVGAGLGTLGFSTAAATNGHRGGLRDSPSTTSTTPEASARSL